IHTSSLPRRERIRLLEREVQANLALFHSSINPCGCDRLPRLYLPSCYDLPRIVVPKSLVLRLSQSRATIVYRLITITPRAALPCARTLGFDQPQKKPHVGFPTRGVSWPRPQLRQRLLHPVRRHWQVADSPAGELEQGIGGR